MLRLTIFAFIVYSLIFGCTAENQEVSINDTVLKFQKFAYETGIDSSLIYLRKSQQLIHSNPNQVLDSLKAENDYLIGTHFRKKGSLDSAEVYLQGATNRVINSIKNWREFAYIYELYDVYLAKQKYGDIIAIANQVEVVTDSSYYLRLSYPYYFRAIAYQEMGYFEKSINQTQGRIRNLLAAGDTTKVYPALITEAKLSYNLHGNTKRTFKILDSIIRISKDKLSCDYLRQLYGNYGVYKYYDGDYRSARDYYKKGLEFAKIDSTATDYIDLVSNSYNNLMEASIDLKEYRAAEAYEDTILQLGVHKLSRRRRQSFFKYQYRLASRTAQGESKILQTLDTLSKYQDLVYSEKINSELEELKRTNEEQRILEKEKQAAEIASINLRNQSIVLGISLVLLSLTGIFFFRQRKLRFEKQELQMQQRLLRSQMNPHFTFNTLYAIQNKIKDDTKAATNYLLKFSRLLRLILENSMQNYISLEKELESLQEYMDLQLLRFPERFSYTIDTQELEDIDLLFIPPMLLQPMVENSIEHGFSNIDYHGTIRILLKPEGQFIRCIIEDNGQGIQNNDLSTKRSASTQLISDYLIKATKSKLEVIDKKNLNSEGHGVLVRFLIPYKETENG